MERSSIFVNPQVLKKSKTKQFLLAGNELLKKEQSKTLSDYVREPLVKVKIINK